MTVGKADLVKAVAETTGMQHKTCDYVLNMFYATVSNQLADGNDVVIPGFGKFMAAKLAARKGRNPRTGETIDIPASVAVRFKAGKALKTAVNK